MTPAELNKDMLALLIQEGAAHAAPIREALAQGTHCPVRVQCVERLSMALARIAGGGVDLVLLDFPAGKAWEARMDSLLSLLRGAPLVPIVVVCEAGEDGLAVDAMRSGAMDYVVKDNLPSDLGRVVRSVIEMARAALPPAVLKMPERRPNGGIIALLGAKGGVGVTTIALNVAASLARRGTVILAEVRPTFGTLSSYLLPHGFTRNLSHLLELDCYDTDLQQVRSCLWGYKKVPGLSILFGPQTAEECQEIEPGQANAILQSLAHLADYVIVDLPASLSEANRSVLERSNSMALVVEPDPVCVQSARWMVRAIESWNAAQQPIGVVIVNRALVNFPMPLSEIDALLGSELLETIPSAADLCLNAQNAGMPVVLLHPESLVANGLKSLSALLAPAADQKIREISRYVKQRM